MTGMVSYKNWVFGTAENDTLSANDKTPITIKGYAGDDYIRYYAESGYPYSYMFGGNELVVFGDEGNDTISVSNANSSSITGGEGDDVVNISYGDYGDWTINYHDGDGDDTVTGYVKGVINIASGTIDTVYANDKDVIIKVGDGSILLKNASQKNITIKDASGNTTSQMYTSLEILGTSNGDSIESNLDNATIKGGAGNDTIHNSGSYTFAGKDCVIYGDTGNDYITSHTRNDTIFGGEGNDTVKLYPVLSGITVYGGAGDDYIDNECHTAEVAYNPYGNPNNYSAINGMLFGEEGNDTISDGGNGTTIDGGLGNDYIELKGKALVSSGVYSYFKKTLLYAAGDGNDTVVGLENTGELKLQLSDTYSTVVNGDDMLVQVGKGSILFVGGASHTVSIAGGTMTQPTENSTTPAQDNTDTTPTETSTSQQTETTTTPPAETNVLQIENSRFTYSGGNKNIITYTSEKINFQADFTGIGFNATDFMINSSSGSLAIKNARDKILDVAVNNNTVAYAYYASGGGNLDGSSFSQLEVIIGGNNSANTITAGSGGSSLWGGTGGNDIFTGGAGQDNFFFGKNDGTDIINNAGSSDVVNLYDVSLADIISANVSGSQISVTFNTGSDLQINSAESLSAKFNLADGSWKFNHSSGIWQNA